MKTEEEIRAEISKLEWLIEQLETKIENEGIGTDYANALRDFQDESYERLWTLQWVLGSKD